jgi:hypothetical protein
MTSLETTSGGRPYWRYDWRALDGRSISTSLRGMIRKEGGDDR